MLRKTFLVIVSLVILPKLYAQVVSLSQTPGTITVKSLPASKSTWTNPANALASDNAFTTASVQNKKHSDLLVATNWGFSVGNGPNQIPASAVINGFEVEIQMKGSNNSIRDYIIQLRKNNSTSSNDLSRSNSAWPQTLSYVKFGSSTNMWGLSWTPAEIAASTFGVEIAAQGRTAPGTAMIDHIKITIYYNLRFYYSKSTGNLTTLGTWGINTDGTGTAPTNFTDSGQIFNLRNRAATTLNANLTLSGQATKLIVGDGITTTALTIPSTAVLNSLLDVTANGALNISNTISPTLGALLTNSTVAYSAAGNQTVQELTYYNLIMAGSGIKTSAVTGNAITVNGNLTINSGITFNNTDQDLVANGNISNSGTTTGPAFIWMNGIAASTISGTNGVFSNVRTDNDFSVTLSSAQTITDTLTLTAQPFTVGSSLNLNAGAIIVRDDGTLSASPGSNNLYDIQYIGVTKTTGPEISSSFIRNFKVSLVDTLPNTLTLSQALSLSGYLQLDSGTLDAGTSNYNITVYKNVIANSTLNNRSNTFTLNGVALQTISGTNPITFYKLSVNNSSAPGVQLLAPAQVTNLLNFANGILTTDNTNTLTLGSTATTLGSNPNKYINGPLSKTLATTINTTFMFPVGANSLVRPVTLEVTQASATSTTYTVELVNSAPSSATLPGTLTSVSAYRHYKVSKSPGANVTIAFITLNYGAEDNITLPANTRIAERSGSNWINLAGIATSIPSGSIRSAINFTTFNDFVLADNTSVLPINIVSFKGSLNNGIVKLQWITGNEINVDHYNIEKSVNGIDWGTAGTMQSASAPQLQNTYTANDNNPYNGTNYYRLKIVDKNLAYTFSNVISILNYGVVVPKILMLPNVISNKQSTLLINGIVFNANETVVVNIYNSNGSLLQKRAYNAQNQVPLILNTLPPGIYSMAAQLQGRIYTSSFVIQ